MNKPSTSTTPYRLFRTLPATGADWTHYLGLVEEEAEWEALTNSWGDAYRTAHLVVQRASSVAVRDAALAALGYRVEVTRRVPGAPWEAAA